MTIDIVKTTDPGFTKKLDRILQRRGEIERDVVAQVSAIIENVRRQGDKALLRYTREFDGVSLKRSQLEVSADEMDRACETVSKQDLRWLRLAAARIKSFHSRQLEKSWHFRDPLGLELGQRITPVERAGAYVPGGKATYPSTVLMTVIPAVAAGVREVVITTPFQKQGGLVLAAARVAGAHRIFRVG